MSATSSKSSTSSAKPSSSSRTPLVIGLVVAAVVVIGLIVIVLGSGDDGETASTTIPAPVETDGTDDGDGADGGDEVDDRLPPAMVGEVRPVTVEGEPLPSFTGGDDPALGMVPPTIDAEDYTGFIHTISPDTADPVLVVFLAHWCPHCNNEVPRLIQLQQEGRLPADLRVVGVSTAVNAQQPNFPPSQWLAGREWPFEVLVDGIDADGAFKASNAYGVDGFPFVTCSTRTAL
jgi:cytochrome c biogenesis protein CcmG, thiol:disulfide interchange protein DsbE